MATNQGFKSLVPGPLVDARYLYHWLKSNTALLQSLGNGATFKELSKAAAARIRIPLPPLEEQRRIADTFDRIDELICAYHEMQRLERELADAMFLAQARSTGPRLQLRDLTTVITKGTTPTSIGHTFKETGIPFVRVQNLQDRSVAFGSHDLFIDEAAHKALARSQIQPGDVLVSIAGTIGRVAVVSPDAPSMNCNQAVAIVRLRELWMAPWIAAWLESNDAQAQVRSAAVTATISNLSLTQLGGLLVPLVDHETASGFAQRSSVVAGIRSCSSRSVAALAALSDSLAARAFSVGV